MDKKILSDKNTIAKKERLIIMSEQTFDVIERHECGHSNSKIGWHVRMSGSMVWNIIKYAGEIYIYKK